VKQRKIASLQEKELIAWLIPQMQEKELRGQGTGGRVQGTGFREQGTGNTSEGSGAVGKGSARSNSSPALLFQEKGAWVTSKKGL
jgi:hypothetical protein